MQQIRKTATAVLYPFPARFYNSKVYTCDFLLLSTTYVALSRQVCNGCGRPPARNKVVYSFTALFSVLFARFANGFCASKLLFIAMA